MTLMGNSEQPIKRGNDITPITLITPLTMTLRRATSGVAYQTCDVANRTVQTIRGIKAVLCFVSQ